MNIDRSAPVLVTGGNGYIASWLVKYLLEDGIDVHATVRDPSNDTKVGHLKQIAKDAPGSLTLFEADLLHDGAFDEAMAGCELVFHTASPFVLAGIKDPQKDLVDPAVQGTRTVLESANRVSSVKRVVLTSSVVSIYGDAADQQGATCSPRTTGTPPAASRTSRTPTPRSRPNALPGRSPAPRTAGTWWSINPGFVLGPVAHHRQRLGQLRHHEAARRRDDADGRAAHRARHRRRARRRADAHQGRVHPRRRMADTSASAGRCGSWRWVAHSGRRSGDAIRSRGVSCRSSRSAGRTADSRHHGQVRGAQRGVPAQVRHTASPRGARRRVPATRDHRRRALPAAPRRRARQEEVASRRSTAITSHDQPAARSTIASTPQGR